MKWSWLTGVSIWESEVNGYVQVDLAASENILKETGTWLKIEFFDFESIFASL